jgi:uncharacterized LabA/DUF88 family protein
MPTEPATKRAIAFFDGQNLYRHAKDAFGHHHPNYDPLKLTDAICAMRGWKRHGVRFYTGIPDAQRDPFWHAYWANRLLAMRRAGILVTTRPIRYREIETRGPDGSIDTVTATQEKGIDIRLALDIIRLGLSGQYDVALIFSQDQDLAELVEDVREIAKSQDRWLKLACAFPVGPRATSGRGIANTDWIGIDKKLYNSCVDPRDYRAKHAR